MSFKRSECIIPEVWCGTGPIPKNKDKRYTEGSPLLCLRKGFGAGTNQEKLKTLPKNSLQRIKYVGEKYEERFSVADIDTTTKLIKEMKKKSKDNISKFLKSIFSRKGVGLDRRAYNSTILYLHDNGVDVPRCEKIE
jgi:hypothetical protein